jgi:hypothetical protein
VEPKTLGLGILSGKIFKNVFEHLGVVATPLRCLQMVLYTWSWLWEVKELVDFGKMVLCISVRQTNYPRATTLPQYGTGLSLKFICFCAGSLTLYKGL